MAPGPPRRRRARPVADAPVDALLSNSEDLAKGWLLALLEDAPLQDAQEILAGDLSRDGPRVCEAVLRALVSETDLHRLEPGGALTPLASRTGELAGARGPEATSRAVDALHGVIWAALSDELRGPDPALVSELAERLALVIENLRAAVLRRGEVGTGDGGQRPPAPVQLAPEPPSPSEPQGTEEPPTAPAAGSSEGAPERSWPAAERSWPAAESRLVEAHPQTLWVEALEDEIRAGGGAPLSLLVAELEDADRVGAVESGPAASATFSQFAQAVRSVVRRQDILVSETEIRAWVIARNTARGGAHALGDRIAAAVRERPQWRGAALIASVGVAVLGEDGRNASELVDAAEEARFAASAAGVGVGNSGPGDDVDG